MSGLTNHDLLENKEPMLPKILTLHVHPSTPCPYCRSLEMCVGLLDHILKSSSTHPPQRSSGPLAADPEDMYSKTDTWWLWSTHTHIHWNSVRIHKVIAVEHTHTHAHTHTHTHAHTLKQCYNQGCAMTVWRYSPSKCGLTVDAVNDGVRLSFRNLGTVMTVHDGTVDSTVRKPQKGQKMAFWPQIGHSGSFLLIS